MLIEFRVENHRSLRDEQAITMEASSIGDVADDRPRRAAGHTVPLLPVAVLYGANASGKSNVLSALAFMQEAVMLSHRTWSPDEGVPRDPFAWGISKSSPSLFEVTILANEVRYQYGFRASDGEFLEEWLHAWPHGKKQIWFERDGSVFKFGDNLRGENKLIEEVTRSNALFLSAAIQHKHQQLDPVFAWFRAIQPVNLTRGFGRRGLVVGSMSRHALARLFHEGAHQLFPDDTLEQFRALLRSADIGIVDFRVDSNDADQERRRLGGPRFVMKHSSASSAVEEAWLPLEEESSGTRTLFRLGLPILETLRNGGILLVDELEASLHPSLAQQIVHQFNDPATNSRNAQLIFTTHDTNLLGTTLGEPEVRRDQVWLTEKDTEGATVLYPLTDFKPRKAENLERGYLQGRYGAIPFLGDFFGRQE